MSWFEEQLRERKQQDDALFCESMENVASSILGRTVSADKDEITNDEIKNILKYYGFNTKAEVPQGVNTFSDRLSYLCRPHGLMYREVKLTENWWKDCIGAILAFKKEDGSAVALIPYGFGYVYYEGGKRQHVNRKFNETLTGTGYCFYKPFPNRKLNLIDLVKYAISTRSLKDMVLTVMFMLVSTLIGLLTPKISYFLYSTVVESGSNRLLYLTMLFMACVSVSMILFKAFQTMYESIVATKMRIALQGATMMRILSLPPAFFRKFSSGELAEKSNYLTGLAQTVMDMIFSTGLTSLFSLIYITSIFEYAPALVVPALIVILVTVGFSMLSVLARQKISKETMEISTKESGMTYAMVSGMKKIRIAGAEKRAFARWANLYSQKVQRTYNPPRFIKVNSTIALAISAAGTLVMYAFAIKSGVSMAEYTAFTAAYGMLFGAFSTLTSLVSSCANIKPIIDMAKPVMDEIPESNENKETVTRLSGRIELNNVSFRYDDSMPLIVDDMTLKIEPNQYIGIVGKTGCGKSTLIRLLLGFEKAQKGAIYYDGKDINTLDLKSLRRKIGVVMQDSKLFHGDIFSNITISAPWLTLNDAWEAAETADIADDISDMPMGMNTLISEGSGGVSGGQKQRLIIARAVAPKPKILIFDEATSALDNITQKKVSAALDNLHCTRIVIAHRLSTIKHCDRILYLENGKICEDGTYDQLMEKQGMFYQLVQRQRVDA